MLCTETSGTTVERLSAPIRFLIELKLNLSDSLIDTTLMNYDGEKANKRKAFNRTTLATFASRQPAY